MTWKEKYESMNLQEKYDALNKVAIGQYQTIQTLVDRIAILESALAQYRAQQQRDAFCAKTKKARP